jgi:hypothetical protein
MIAEEPQIPDFVDRRARWKFGHRIGRVVIPIARVLERSDPQIYLAHLGTGNF